MDVGEQYRNATIMTSNNLRTIAHSQMVQELSSMSLPEVDAVVDLISKVAPAGNVPGVILSGLVRLPQRRPPPNTVRRDIHLLFKGVEQALLDKAVYGAFFAGPAAVIWAYQNLLKLAGKDPDASFPEGTWQFYVDYALRDDTARHACETRGFDAALIQHHMRLDPVDRLTAWTMAAIHCLHQYDALLANEWRERVYTYLLQQVTQGRADAARYDALYRTWQKKRPYSRGPDVHPGEDFPTYRRRKFDEFLTAAMRELPDSVKREWESQAREAGAVSLPAYQKQMSILAYLEPGNYGETRTPVPLAQAHIGIIFQNHYYLLPACAAGSDQAIDVATVRAQIAALMAHPSDAPAARLAPLAEVRRAAVPHLRQELDETLRQELDTLRLAPICLNFDQRPRQLPLAALRQVERGVGDHALTIFDTAESFIFDLSHIFFDGTWGAALAEILTNEALSWAVYLNTLSPPQPGHTRPYSPVLHFSTADARRVKAAPHVATEASVETTLIDLKAMLELRKLFKQRSDLLQLTVNDLLVLYRGIHAAVYEPEPALADQLKKLAQQRETKTAATEALETIEKSKTVNPAILIPVDATRRAPRERVYPMTFEVPLGHLDLLALHQRTVTALETYEAARGKESHSTYNDFEELKRNYLGTLAGFGEVLSKAKEIAIAGESASVGSIKLLAHLPTPIQRLLDKIPGRFDVLNDIIRGREVFSNIGAVAPGSTLSRFMTAKDDNEKKSLAWGVMTDAEGVMYLTLRDFRPYVAALADAGQYELALRIAKDYLDAYANGLNDYMSDLKRIVTAKRRTRRFIFGKRT